MNDLMHNCCKLSRVDKETFTLFALWHCHEHNLVHDELVGWFKWKLLQSSSPCGETLTMRCHFRTDNERISQLLSIWVKGTDHFSSPVDVAYLITQ